ncbi:uncharacterized protein CIMG_13301 [Coccidioides immitis RS]|uniref:Uncharacterized protein n=1 Tax=Coccidioides immitis (strain RS) TaxID=246410 RepID=A0A0D8JU59_COCIM|nr:uncharacterized protein CIMG_13301 [Coccidioides immitis RS]KJF60885.1 hypothetical protein CIMG_13301 [Coccidioides immitis RS]
MAVPHRSQALRRLAAKEKGGRDTRRQEIPPPAHSGYYRAGIKELNLPNVLFAQAFTIAGQYPGLSRKLPPNLYRYPLYQGE